MNLQELKAHRKEYNNCGYTIYPGHIDSTTCQKLKDSCFEDLTNLIFRNYPKDERPDLRDKVNWPILTSSAYRKEKGFTNEDVWNGGNSRKPYWSKNNGMYNVYYNRDCHKAIHFNPDTYVIIASLYGHNKIRLTRGMERLCIKLGEIKIKNDEGETIKYPGSTDMPTHLDYHLFNDEINTDRDRVQAFVCIEVDEEIDPRNSGGLQVIPYFHLYWDIAKRYFRKDGKHPLSEEEYKVFTPQPWGKQFNKELPKFNEFLQKLHGTISATSKEDMLIGSLKNNEKTDVKYRIAIIFNESVKEGFVNKIKELVKDSVHEYLIFDINNGITDVYKQKSFKPCDCIYIYNEQTDKSLPWEIELSCGLIHNAINIHQVEPKVIKIYEIVDEVAEYMDLLHTLPEKYHRLEWTPLKIKKGDLVCWNQKLPHSSLRNKSSIPRIVSYVTFMPTPSKSRGYDYEWEGSEQQKKLIEAIKSGKDGFHQGSNRDNNIERKYLRDDNFEYWYKPREQPDSKLFKHDNLELYQKFCDYLQGL